MADKTEKNKRKHKTLSLAKKIEILHKLESGHSKVKLAREYNVGRATVYDIRRNRKKIENFVNASGVQAHARHTLRHCEYLLMEDMLFDWFLEERVHNPSLTEKVIQNKALHFYKEIYKNDGFRASDGWYRNFKSRYGIKGIYEPLLNKNVKKTIEMHSKQNDEDIATTSENVNCEETSKIDNIVPKTEPKDTSDSEKSEGFTWPNEQAKNVTVEHEKHAFGQIEVTVEYEESDSADDSMVFASHLKARLDRLSHQQKFIAQKLMSDVLMLAETNQLQISSAIVNRRLKKERTSTDDGTDPLTTD